METIINELKEYKNGTEIYKNIEKICQYKNYKYDFDYDDKCKYIIIKDSKNIYIIQNRLNIKKDKKIKKELKYLNVLKCNAFYKKMKKIEPYYWNNKSIFGISIDLNEIELNCYNIGKHIIQCEGVINKNVYVTEGRAVYWL
jgi:hypothetical protein